MDERFEYLRINALTTNRIKKVEGRGIEEVGT